MNTKKFYTEVYEIDHPSGYSGGEDETIEGIFSWAALEHVISPEIAFQEIDRVLKKGGHALIAPAWNCRPWIVKKLEDRSYSVLSISESIGKFLIPLRELIIVRALIAFPKRLWGELGLLTGLKQPLRYRALSPRWDLIEKYGHVSDDDAAVSYTHLTLPTILLV